MFFSRRIIQCVHESRVAALAEIPREQFPRNILVASSWRPREDVANIPQGNQTCRTRML